MRVRHVFVPFSRPVADRRGLSERVLKKRLERQGWTVWLGHGMNMLEQEELFPTVLRKYTLLVELLKHHHPDTLEELQYLCHVHHGLPDYLCYRRGVFLWVECKLGHEQLQESQRKCFPKLAALGFTVEVHKLVDPCTKTREAWVDIHSGEKEVVERQARLKRRYP